MKKREGSRWIEERRDKENNLLCLIPTCNNKREKYKTNNRTRNYCENHNGYDIHKFNSWEGVRNRAFKRDSYTCVKCGKKDTDTFIGDHIIPIALGGEEFDIDNVQTLCIACNKIKTKQDIKDIAKQRRKEKLEKQGQKTL